MALTRAKKTTNAFDKALKMATGIVDNIEKAGEEGEWAWGDTPRVKGKLETLIKRVHRLQAKWELSRLLAAGTEMAQVRESSILSSPPSDPSPIRRGLQVKKALSKDDIKDQEKAFNDKAEAAGKQEERKRWVGPSSSPCEGGEMGPTLVLLNLPLLLLLTL